MDWSVALRVGGPSVLAAWGFYHLMSEYMSESSIFKGDIYLNALAIICIFVFFLALAWLWLRKPSKSAGARVVDNKVIDNEVKGSLRVKSNEVANNEISKNKIDGDFTIGE